MKREYNILQSNPVRLLLNILWVYICYEICRLVFLFENWNLYSGTMSWGLFWKMSLGGFRFDTSAIFYTNALVILLYLLPWAKKEVKWYHSMTKWIYVVINSLCVVLNFGDSVFFEFRKHRSSMATVQEFQNEGNLGSIFWEEFFGHWYLVLLAIVLIIFLWKCYRSPFTPVRPPRRYYVTQIVGLVIFAPITVMGMRGNTFFTATRPIAVSYSHNFVNDPMQTGIVLNTPFSLIRTIGQMPQKTPVFFTDHAELDAIYNPVHLPGDSIAANHKNVVIFIVESFAQEFIGELNKDLDNGTYMGYTPFADSLLRQSLYFDQSFANSGFSIDAPPSILASIPRMDRPFVLSPFSLNHLNSIATELKNIGYNTAFFHGADNESLGFNAFVKSIGFEKYFGRTEFYADPRFGGKSEFDGTWGVWDEPFLQYFCAEIGEMPQPFLASVFTLSSHHPFAVPEKYKDVFVDEGIHKLHKCIRYADFSLRRFFETASKQPWFKNTIFVLTADHASSKRTHEVYKNEVGGFRVPILFYDPSGELPVGKHPGIAQQIDIMPTILNYVGYDRPYVAFGKDLLNTKPEDTWAFNWDFYPQFFKGEYVMRSDGEKVTEIFNYVKDPLLKENLVGKLPQEKEMEREMQAIIQSYMQRMSSDQYNTLQSK